MLIGTHPRSAHDPSFGGHFGSEGFHCSAPAQITPKILGGDAVEPTDPFIESAVVGVHVVDVMFGRLRPRVSGCGQDVDFEFGATRERRDGRPSIAAKVSGRGNRAQDYRERCARLTGERIDICPFRGGRMVDVGSWPHRPPPRPTPYCDTS